VKKADLCKELVAHVTHASKTVLFRTCKFIEDELEEMEVTRELIPYLPNKLKMSEDEFITNYSDIVYEGIKACRTDVQSNGKKRAQGTSNVCKIGLVLGNCRRFALTFFIVGNLHRIVLYT
jgi:hypothetical protein